MSARTSYRYAEVEAVLRHLKNVIEPQLGKVVVERIIEEPTTKPHHEKIWFGALRDPEDNIKDVIVGYQHEPLSDLYFSQGFRDLLPTDISFDTEFR